MRRREGGGGGEDGEREAGREGKDGEGGMGSEGKRGRRRREKKEEEQRNKLSTSIAQLSKHYTSTLAHSHSHYSSLTIYKCRVSQELEGTGACPRVFP